MIVSHLADYQSIQKAVDIINHTTYMGNVKIFSEGITSLNGNGSRVRFRLSVKSNKAKGHKVSRNFGKERHLSHACWHVHGDFFDALLAIEPNAVIFTGLSKIYRLKDGSNGIMGNWQDRNIGSIVAPVMYSESCDC